MAINSVGDFILFLGKAGVVTAVVFIGIELIKVLILSWLLLLMQLWMLSFVCPCVFRTSRELCTSGPQS